MSTLKWTRTHFSLHISVDLDGRGQREVKWANFVQPKSGLNDKTSTELGPVKQAKVALLNRPKRPILVT